METAQVESTTPADPGQGATTEPAAAAPVDAGTQPSTPAEPVAGVQPTTPEATTQPDGGQGLIAPYLEGVDEAHRDIVTDVLEKYRKDSDANVTKRFEELNGFKQYAESPEALQAPVFLYERLMEEPLETIQWVLERFETEAGVDLKSQLKAALTGEPAEPAPTAEPTDDPDDRPLTRREWEQLEQQREQDRQAEQQTAQRRELAEGWLNEAAQTHGLTLTAGTDVAVRHAILTHAAQLLPTFKSHGAEAGKAAIATAVEAFVNTYRGGPKAASDTTPTPEPKVADGGTPPAPSEVTDLTDEKARKAYMLAMLQGSKNQE